MTPSERNVFSGADSLRDFTIRGRTSRFLYLVELPEHPFTSFGVRIYAKMLTMTPSANVKALPALNMMLRAEESGEYHPHTDKIVECSSGNTILSLAILNNLYGAPDITPAAYISNKTSLQKLQMLRFFGLEVKLFGGPAQVEPSDPLGGIYAAIEDGKKENHWNPGQYSNFANSEAHMRWTGPQLIEQLPSISVFAAAIGTSGTMTGTGTYLRSVRPDIVNLGVFTAPGDRVPGPRPIDLIQAVDLPWREVITCEEHVSSIDSYAQSLELCRQGLLCGPSSGLALKGLYQYLEKMKTEGRLDALRGADGFVSCAFICCDLPFLYISEYFSKLAPSAFPPVLRPELLDADLYPYGIDWKITFECARELVAGKTTTIVLDLRDSTDFANSHVVRAVNLDLNASKEPNPFLNPEVLVRQWTVLNEVLKDYARPLDGDVVVLSYDGHSASIATSVLRHYGARAFYVGGGYDAEVWKAAGLETSDSNVKPGVFQRFVGLFF
ncbi:tryptophan synthase beta subunit-like PLP-dependent enzyme [Mucidula mucida]|nr:tryptophan synthase beta subunit-like PLP-dependent enzyme [Mucidula mucida]